MAIDVVTMTIAKNKAVKEAEGEFKATYKPQGDKTFEELTEPTDAQLGYVYNVTDGFVTDDRFIEGAGKRVKAGTNVMVVQRQTPDGKTVYKYDLMADNDAYQLDGENLIIG